MAALQDQVLSLGDVYSIEADLGHQTVWFGCPHLPKHSFHHMDETVHLEWPVLRILSQAGLYTCFSQQSQAGGPSSCD